MDAQARIHVNAANTNSVIINTKQSFSVPITCICVSDFTVSRTYPVPTLQLEPSMHLCLYPAGNGLQVKGERHFFNSTESNLVVLATTNLCGVVGPPPSTTRCFYRQEGDSMRMVVPSLLTGNLVLELRNYNGQLAPVDITFSFVLTVI